MKRIDILKLSFKNKYKIIFLTLILSTVLFAFLGLSPVIEKHEQIKTLESYYINTKFDIIVPSPSDTQISDLLNTASIENISPYYLTETSIIVNENNSSNIKLMMFDNNESLSITPFNNLRNIKGRIPLDGLGISYDTANSLSLKIGDTVKVTINGLPITRKISNIIENDIEENYTIVIIDNEIRDILNQISFLPYSGAYIEFKDKSKISEFTTNYIAYGLIRDRENFDGTEEEYNSHVQSVLNANYKIQIINKNIKTSDMKKEINLLKGQKTLNLSIAITIAILTSVIPLFLITKKDIKFGKGLIKKEIKKENVLLYFKSGVLFYHFFNIIFTLLVFLIVYIIKVKIHSLNLWLILLAANLVGITIFVLIDRKIVLYRLKKELK